MNAIESASYWIARVITAAAFDLIPTVRVPRRSTATYTLTCQGCGELTYEPSWCAHDRVTGPCCEDFTSCVHCAKGRDA